MWNLFLKLYSYMESVVHDDVKWVLKPIMPYLLWIVTAFGATLLGHVYFINSPNSLRVISNQERADLLASSACSRKFPDLWGDFLKCREDLSQRIAEALRSGN